MNNPHELLPTANRILVKHQVLDAFGHVSMRDPSDPEKFWISRNLAPLSVEASDLQQFDLGGTTSDERKSYLEVFIHSEIYRSRPDVGSIIHSHAASVIPYSVVQRKMECVSHMAGFLARGIPNFEVRDEFGPNTDLLIRTREMGQALARTLSDYPVALMRGHGAVIVGESVQEAVHRAVYTVLNASVLTTALQIDDEVMTLTANEGEAIAEVNRGQLERSWNLWASQAANLT